MVTLCLTCGDAGFGQVMVNCPVCGVSAQHVYFLDVKPFKYHEKDFTWVCDECKPATAPLESHDNRNSKNSKKSKKKKTTGSVAKTSEYHVKSFQELVTSVVIPQLAASDPSEIIEDRNNTAQLIVVPTWRGTLSIMNKDFSIVNGHVAHISNLACAQVFEDTKLLSGILHVNLVSRVGVWPKAFQSCRPSDSSIALFFPDRESNVKDFNNLAESMIWDDLAMQAVLENAELFIFTSYVLPEHLQRFQTKYYVWGVFK